jgi:nucleoside-diphosphate-sugar epimerase
VRAGDFFGSHQPSSWLKDVMVKPGAKLRSVTYPGDREAGHAWAYLPDLAETIARLADIEASLPEFDTVHFAGYRLARGVEIAEAIRRVVGKPDLPIRRFPWILIRLAAPFVSFFGELVEMRYLWEVSLQLDNRKLLSLIGPEPHRSLDEALRQTLSDLGCLPGTPAQASAAAARSQPSAPA